MIIQNQGVELEECVFTPGLQGDGVGVETTKPTGDPVDSTGVCTEYTQLRPYAGMPKEVLLLYSGQARYRVPRQVLFWLLVASILALVALTVAIIALSPQCLGWWQTSPLYRVCPGAFRDSDGDGVGDLKGIQEKLSHFERLSVRSLWIGPFYRSPRKDFGYDVEDFREVDPLFGTMGDFEELLTQMHKRGLKLIMDFVPNHTSDRHRWFNLSRTREPRYQDYYVWTNCSAAEPRPNNWVSVYGNSSWTYDEVRGQCYLHQFLKEQPDLNFRNPHVRREMMDVLRFWLEKGVDGFCMDSVKRLLEAQHLRDEPQTDPRQPPEEAMSQWDLHHDYTTSQLGLHALLQEWRAEMDAYSHEPGRYRLMVTESYDGAEVDKTMLYYGSPLVKESDFPLNLLLLELPHNPGGLRVQRLVQLWMSNMPQGRWPNWVAGNQDVSRVASRVGPAHTRVINMLLLTLPGTPTTYYGEEIGMEDVPLQPGQMLDPAGKHNASGGRDPQRAPMQWSAARNAGFSDGTNGTRRPLHPDYRTVNVEVQQQSGGSVLVQYGLLSALRQAEVALQRGWFCWVQADAQVFVYLRELDGLDHAFLVLLNLSGRAAATDLTLLAAPPPRLTLVLSTAGRPPGAELPAAALPSAPGEGLLLRYHSAQRYHAQHPARCHVSHRACYLGAAGLLYSC